ncbi:MAG: hypothetical protein ACOY90_02255 [Candidatus Zhuqueibacterota bacterium]|jgi:hypothetical protein
MVVYGTYKQISRYEGLYFLLNNVTKTIHEKASSFDRREEVQIAYDTVDGHDEQMMIRKEVEVEEYVLA